MMPHILKTDAEIKWFTDRAPWCYCGNKMKLAILSVYTPSIGVKLTHLYVCECVKKYNLLAAKCDFGKSNHDYKKIISLKRIKIKGLTETEN